MSACSRGPRGTRCRVLTALGAVALALLGAPAWAAPLAARETLPNGIVLLVAERPAIPIVAVRVFHRAGAVFDPPDRTGLAHLTGEVVTRGAGGRSAREIDAAIESVGGFLEAGAGRDGLRVSLGVLKRDLALGLDLLRDAVLAPAFPEPEVKRKVAEIRAALERSEEDPETVAHRELRRLVFGTHPYGQPVPGTRESVARLTRDDVVAFHRRHVRPDTTIIAVVGAITVSEARHEILARFGAWQAPPTLTLSVPAAAGGPAPATETIARELTQTTIMLGRQAVNQLDPDYFALRVAAYVMGGGSASRLYARVREQAGLAYSVFGWLEPGVYGGAVTVSAQTRTAEAARVLDILREELDRLGREPVSKEELELAKAYLTGSFVLRLDTSAKVAEFLVAVEQLGLGLEYPDRYRAGIAAVTADDIRRVSAAYLQPSTFSRVIVGSTP